VNSGRDSRNSDEETRATYSINFNDPHVVSIQPREEHGERGGVDDAKTVGLASLERNRCVLVIGHSIVRRKV
jgi:hypothetical protein